MKNLIILLSFIFLPQLFAKDSMEHSDAELEEMIEDDSAKLVQIRDIDSGLMVDRHRIKDDRNRISFLFHGNTNLYKIADVTALEFNYAHHFKNYWMEFFYMRTQADFYRIVDETNSGDLAGSSALDESNDELNIFGVGVSMRGAWIQELINSESIYTHTAANFGYYTLNQNFSNRTYKGPGLKADLGLHVRNSKSMHYGVRTTYHLAHVKRPQAFTDESSSSRSLLLTWMTIGVDLSFYF
jgi:hypothetical protein